MQPMIISLTPEQCNKLAELAAKHNTAATVYGIGNPNYGHVEVEFMFPHRYMITKNGTVFECYDLEYNKYREVA